MRAAGQGRSIAPASVGRRRRGHRGRRHFRGGGGGALFRCGRCTARLCATVVQPFLSVCGPEGPSALGLGAPQADTPASLCCYNDRREGERPCTTPPPCFDRPRVITRRLTIRVFPSCIAAFRRLHICASMLGR